MSEPELLQPACMRMHMHAARCAGTHAHASTCTLHHVARSSIVGEKADACQVTDTCMRGQLVQSKWHFVMHACMHTYGAVAQLR